MNKFDSQNFVDNIYESHKEIFEKEEIIELLEISDEVYKKDNPTSTGKSLKMNKILFKGKKANGDIIDYSQKLFPGINIWIGDNNKGKSSTLKMIKFALTGDNKLKEDIKDMIDEILLSFSIAEKHYTVYIKNKKPLIGRLYNSFYEDWETFDFNIKPPLFETNSVDEFKNAMEEFFFQQFDYYSLKWTQKPSQKDRLDLLEISSSWTTYFKSIYLESKDYSVLFFDGNLSHQGQKVFQMLMGLHLTYPINKLTIKRDKKENEKGRQKNILDSKSKQIKDEILKLQQELDNIVAKLNLPTTKPQNSRIEKLNEDFKKYKDKYDTQVAKLDANRIESDKLKADKEKHETKKYKLEKEISFAKREIDKLNKEVLALNEYLQGGILFSNLEIKNCPSCHHTVTETKKKENIIKHQCPLCNDSLTDADETEDPLIYQNKVKNINEQILNLNKLIKESEQEYITTTEALKNNYYEIIKNKQQKDDIGDLNETLQRINEIQIEIQIELKKVPIDFDREALIEKKGKLTYQIEQLNNRVEQSNNLDKLNNEIKLLNSAIESLISIRYDIGKSILKKLEDLMLLELHTFNLMSISEVRITEKFDIEYKQSNKYIKFSEITEGEQLRAKLAFYLSLIQLDIENNLGRHTRLLMIDSPSKEEVDKKSQEGLTEVLHSIQERFPDQLQILIATADRRFTNIVKNQFIIPEYCFLF